jgi:hypothetical protein
MQATKELAREVWWEYQDAVSAELAQTRSKPAETAESGVMRGRRNCSFSSYFSCERSQL